ncbi:thioredoxin domain-containing protein [Candidatus Woesearchaeota archaeon]|nr:thioredoxin domain-containing protein [Candidatus Woesearchaeota archaeon]
MLAVIIPIALIVLLGIALANIDRIFPSPSATGKIIEIASMVNYTPGNYSGINPNASVNVIEFSDFQCPACAAAVSEVHKIRENYGDEVNVIFQHFPFHTDSFRAAEAAECARDQGKFWEYHDILFMNQGDMKTADLYSYAQILDIDLLQFQACLSSGIKTAVVNEGLELGKEAGLEGTPTFFINSRMLAGVHSFEEMKKIIDAELEK